MTQEQYYWYVLRPRQLRANAIAAAGYVDGPTEGGYWTCDEDEYGIAGTIVPYTGNFVWEDEDGCVLKRVGNEWSLKHREGKFRTTIAPADSKTLTFTDGEKLTIHIYWVSTEPTKYCFWVPEQGSPLGNIQLEWFHGYSWIYKDPDGAYVYVLTRVGTTWNAYYQSSEQEEPRLVATATGAHDAKTLTFKYGTQDIVMNWTSERPIYEPTAGGYWKLFDDDLSGTVVTAILTAESEDPSAPTWTSFDPAAGGAGYWLGRKESNWFLGRQNESGEEIDDASIAAVEYSTTLIFPSTHHLYHTIKMTWSENEPNLDEITADDIDNMVVNTVLKTDEADEAEAVKVDEAEKTEDEKAEEKE